MLSLLSTKNNRLPGFNPELNPYIKRMEQTSNVLSLPEEVWTKFEDPKKYRLVDLGCGNGHFLQGRLATDPSMIALGIERRFKRVYKTAQKISSYQGFVLRWDIHEFLRSTPPDYWNEIWIQFPDPWPKDKHWKNRMITTELFYEIRRSLKVGGSFCFRSDCRRYFENLQWMNSRMKLFEIVKSRHGELFDAPQTLFQQKLSSVPLYSLEFRALS